MAYTNLTSKVQSKPSKKIDDTKLKYYAKKTEEAKKESEKVVDLSEKIKELESTKDKLIDDIDICYIDLTLIKSKIKSKTTELSIRGKEVKNINESLVELANKYVSYVSFNEDKKAKAEVELSILTSKILDKSDELLQVEVAIEELNTIIKAKKTLINSLDKDDKKKTIELSDLKEMVIKEIDIVKGKNKDIKDLYKTIISYTTKIKALENKMKELLAKESLLEKEQKDKRKELKDREKEVFKKESDISEREKWLGEDRKHLTRVKEDLETTYKVKIKRKI